MQITGIQTIAAPPQVVWDALNDPAVLQRCLPNCEQVERIAADAFRVVMKAAIGPLRARFDGRLRLTDAQPPEACVMVFEGQGGAIGFGQGTSSITLAPHADGTELRYSAQAQVGGKLAQVGSRLIDGVARKMSDDFFEALRRHLGHGAAAEPVEPVSFPAPATVPASPEPTHAVAPANVSTHGNSGLVPAWWLLVAALTGCATTLAGALLLR